MQALVADMQRVAFELQLREGAESDELDPPVSARLGEIAVPATVAYGDRDVEDFEQIARRLHAELPDATLHEITGAGHLLALDQPAAVTQLILRHLDRDRDGHLGLERRLHADLEVALQRAGDRAALAGRGGRGGERLLIDARARAR